MQPRSFGKVVPTPNLSTWPKDSFALIAQPEPQRRNSNNCDPLKKKGKEEKKRRRIEAEKENGVLKK